MILRAGQQIPWTAFTRMKATGYYYGGTFVGTRYRLWHTAGRKIEIGTDKVRNPRAVEAFLPTHLPPQVLAQERRSTLNIRT